MQKKHNLFIEF